MFGKKKVVEEEEIVKKSKKKLPGWVIVPILVVLALGFWGISALSSPKSFWHRTFCGNCEKRGCEGDLLGVWKGGEREGEGVLFAGQRAHIGL